MFELVTGPGLNFTLLILAPVFPAVDLSELPREGGMVNVKVHTLEDELCSVEVEAGCTGRQLKEAIEEATNWVELVCTQCLALGVNAIRDDEVVDFNGEETVFVMVTRRPLPAKIFYRPVGEAKETQQKALALAMRRFASSPVVLEVPWHGLVFGTGQEEVKAIYSEQSEHLRQETPGKDMNFEHRALDWETFEICLPWKYVAGVATDDIVAVLALQSTCMLIGDGHSSAAAVLLLKDGRFLAATARIDEASGLVNYGSVIVSATFYADTCEMLFDALPSFAQAMSEPMTRDWLKEYAFEIEEFSHPWSVQVHAVDLYGWTEGWWPSEDSIRLVVGREGLPNMPLMKFRPAFPQSVLKPFCDLRGIRPALQTALHEVLSTCCTSKGKGRGRGKGKDADDAKDQRPFSEAISLFKAKLEAKLSQIALTQEKEVKSLEPYLDKLEQTEPPESIDYDLQTRFETCFHTWETDFVFGLGRTSVEI